LSTGKKTVGPRLLDRSTVGQHHAATIGDVNNLINSYSEGLHWSREGELSSLHCFELAPAEIWADLLLSINVFCLLHVRWKQLMPW